MSSQFLRLSTMLVTIFMVANIPINSFAQTAAPINKPKVATSKKNEVPKKFEIKNVAIQGQVFVVTQGGSNIKLALVNVAAYLEKDLLQQFDKIWEVERDMRNDAATKVKEAKAETAEAYALSNNLWKDTSAASIAMIRNSGDKNLMQVWIQASLLEDKAKSAHMAAKAREEAAQARSFALFDPRHFIEGFNNPIAVSKTDADGNFDLTLPAGSSYVLAATGKRRAGSSTELYEWIVRVDASRSLKIMLSNDNMLDSKCAECVSLPILKYSGKL
jgi:hypothetical protein